MKKFSKVLSLFTLSAVLGLPAVTAAEMQVTIIRDQVISDSLTAAYTEEAGSAQSVMVYIGDIDHEAVLANLPETAEVSTLSLSAEPEEYTNQREIEAAQAEIMARRAASREAYLKQNTAFAEQYLDGKVEYISKYSPVIIAELTSAEANRLALNGEVGSIELYEIEAVVEDVNETSLVAPLATTANTTDYLNMINATDVHNKGYTGQGIKIGILENELPYSNWLNTFGISNSHCYSYEGHSEYVDYTAVDHATYVTAVSLSVAPDAEYYCAYVAPNYMQPIEWMIDQGVNVINISLLLCVYDQYGQMVPNIYGAVSAWLDHIAFNHSVNIVIGAGNHKEEYPGVLYSGALAYNVITVGAVDRYGTITEFSSYTDMIFSHGSRPDICAPGVNILPHQGLSGAKKGTSFSTPMVSGAIALMCQQDAKLLYYPETIKSLLAANVNNVYTHCTTTPVDSTNPYTYYGAGVLDCLNVYEAIVGSQYICCECFEPNTSGGRQSFTISLQANKITRVALFYLRSAYYDHDSGEITSTTAPKLGFSVYRNGVYYAPALNYSGNLKIVEFTPTVSGTYYVFVDNGKNISEDTWYSIAWGQYD